MKKRYFALLLAATCVAGKGHAQVQPCFTDEVHRRMAAANPAIQRLDEEMERQISNALKKIDYSTAKKTTSATDQSLNDSFWYDIPVVVHIVHDFGAEYLSDDAIFNDLVGWNQVYAKQNGDTVDVLQPFKKWIGNPHIRLHFAVKDPNGNPCKGITRHRSYLTYIGGEQSKLDDWAPSSYVNIWVVNQMDAANGSAAAYAFVPSSAATNPYGDGIICLYNYLQNEGVPGSKTINHEMGHVFSLYHPWGTTNNPAIECGDDEVDDTPPTMGHAETGCTAASLYDTTCAVNYYKLYTSVAGTDSLVNYPDTTNSQNIMDYTYCSKMFTIGQVRRMHAALNSDIAYRNTLWDTTNLINVGVWNSSYAPLPRLDLKPIPEFSATYVSASGSYMNRPCYFVFPGNNVKFTNESWNDTLTALTWNFSNGAVLSTINSTTSVTNSFSQPGWVTMSMTATGNHTGDTTRTWNQAVFVAETTATNATGYYQEFDPSGDRDKWPTFNYYNNEFQWQLANVGLYDGYSMEYIGYDSRINPALGLYPYTGAPVGDFDDMFSIPVDFSNYPAGCNLNFYYSGASRSSNSPDINDTLLIDYSVNKSTTWTSLAILSKGALDNKGALSTAYTPTSMSDWAPKTIALPAAARTPYTTFRFRYKPNVGQDGMYSSGNNFFIDRISFSPIPAGVTSVNMGKVDVAVMPNPTSGDAYVVVKDADNTTAQVIVTDITGKTVYTVSQPISGNEVHILIPHAALEVKGLYLVQTTTGNQTHTQKLVVY